MFGSVFFLLHLYIIVLRYYNVKNFRVSPIHRGNQASLLADEKE